MVDVASKQCGQDGCTKWPTLNKEGALLGLYCSQHKQPDMIDVAHRLCEHVGCKKQPSFMKLINFTGVTRGRYCGSHKQRGMVNVTAKRCEHSKRLKHASFGLDGQSARRFCGSHKQQGMVSRPRERKWVIQLEHKLTGSDRGDARSLVILNQNAILLSHKCKPPAQTRLLE